LIFVAGMPSENTPVRLRTSEEARGFWKVTESVIVRDLNEALKAREAKQVEQANEPKLKEVTLPYQRQEPPGFLNPAWSPTRHEEKSEDTLLKVLKKELERMEEELTKKDNYICKANAYIRDHRAGHEERKVMRETIIKQAKHMKRLSRVNHALALHIKENC